jgi:CO/xanthine dehydrogenase Mo-binding subunit
VTAPTRERIGGVVGESTQRPDGVAKLSGNFAYASDLWIDGMLWGATLRCPFAHAKLTELDTSPAVTMSGVRAVLTQDDVPGLPAFGQVVQDQPVLCDGVARYWGEPVAVVAADDHETARAAVAAIVAGWEPLDAVTDSDEARAAGDTFRDMVVRRGDPEARGTVVIEADYETATQDQAPLGPEAGLAVPDGEGGVDLYVTTQWIHVDHRQIVACLGLEPDAVRCHPVGIGGAFGAREDISLHIHVAMLALRTGRPVRMVYDRTESFAGHVKRHAARMRYRHEADGEGRLVKVTADLVLDGGAYTHTSPAVLANAAFFTVGPYNCDNVFVEASVVRTNNPPAGAMRGFGAVQVCFAYESQMDRIAEALGLHPLEVRRRNAIGPGDPLATSGQIIEGSLPTRRVIDELAEMPLPDDTIPSDPSLLPGGTGLTTPRGSVVRGVGYAVGFKNIGFSEAFDDFTEVRLVLTPAGLEIHSAAIEVGQGMVTVCEQIARTILGIEHVAWVAADTSQIGSAGSTSASRQTQMTGGAVHEAAIQLRDRIAAEFGEDAALEEVTADGPIEQWVRYRHPVTEEPDELGQGNPHAGFVVASHRAVVDVDPDLGLVRIVQIDTVQDAGKALNPQAIVGQLEGGIAQGAGFAIMEELVLEDGVILNPNFTDYLIPTLLDVPEVHYRLVEEPAHWGPFGAKGIGESPTISSTPAIVAAIRAATGRPLTRVPVRPQDIAGV